MHQARSHRNPGQLKAGDHLCGLYETEEEFWALVTASVREGARLGERVLFLFDAHAPEEVLEHLRGQGIDSDRSVQRRQLLLVPARQMYLTGGDLDPEATLARLAAEADRAAAEGYTCLRMLGEMSWFLRIELDAESLLAYESRLDRYFSDRRCVTLCLYDRRCFDASLLLQVVATHPIIAIGGAVYRKPDYVPPETATRERIARSVLRQWLDGLAARRDATESLHQFRQAQKMEAVGRLAGGVAHDFNNLLTAILGYCELVLLRLEPEDPVRREVDEIRRAAERAAALTHQLLAFSRSQVLQPVLVDLGEVVTEVHRMLERIVGEDVELEVRSAPEQGLVLADAGQIQQVIVNLAVNARDAMPEGGKLTIETRNAGPGEGTDGADGTGAESYVVLTVSDTGHGMEEEVQAHLFEPFFTTKDAGKGTGLGLATVHGIVTQSGGRIEVGSRPGSGTTFRIYLPRASVPARPKPPHRSHPRARHGTETILVVEDSLEVRALVCEVLRRQGYRVLEAEGGEAALELCGSQGPIDLLLTDVVMPGMSGRAVAERLSTCSPRLKVLYMSGYTDRAFAELPGPGGEVGFIQKPFQPQDLAQKVREILEES
ncbi:MAG: MEDS domain-containing protein [Deltaproteobacteria bacterium]|nr:MEDS domain-containing protein [Deltaproteobacteria bacterium]